MRKYKIYLLFSLMLFLITCGGQESEIPSMTARMVFGTVKISNTAGVHDCTVGDIIRESDTVMTGDSSMVDIVYGESGLLRINENSRVAFKELIGDRKDSSRLYMERGKIFVTLSKLKKGTFNIYTPTSIASVRGTSFRVISGKGEYIGKIVEINRSTREIIVRASNAAARIKMMDRLHTLLEDDSVGMLAVFPMLTVARCRLSHADSAKLGLLRKGMAVYRGEKKTTQVDVLTGTVKVNPVVEGEIAESITIEVTEKKTIIVNEETAASAVSNKKEPAVADLHPDEIVDIVEEVRSVQPAVIEKLNEALRKEIREEVIQRPELIEERKETIEERKVSEKAEVRRRVVKETQSVETKTAEKPVQPAEKEKEVPEKTAQQENKKKRAAGAVTL